ncbi:hypothetical protein, partial [Novipirellula maiorica]
MLFHQLLVAATIASTMITPSVSPSRPRTARLSRGPAWTDFRSLATSEEAKNLAKESLEGKKRIAVVAISESQNTQDSPSDLSVFATLVREGMRFSDQLVLVDTATTDRLFADANTVDAARSVAEQHNIDLIVCCQWRSPSEIKLVLSKDDSPLETKVISLPDADSSIIAAAISARTDVMKSFDAFPDNLRNAIELAPNGSLSSIKLWCRGTQQLRRVVTIEDPEQRKRNLPSNLSDRRSSHCRFTRSD